MSTTASLQEQQAEPLANLSDVPTEKKVKKKKAPEGLALMPLDGDVTTLNPLAVAALSPDGMLPSPLGGEAKKKKKKLQRAGTIDESAGTRRKKKSAENGTEASSAAAASATSPTSPAALIAGEGLIFHKSMSNLANLSCMAREDLVKEIETLIDQLQRKEIDVAGLRSENEQFLSMVERTNTALLELKSNVDMSIYRNEAMIADYQKRIKTLTDKLEREREKHARTQNKLSKLEQQRLTRSRSMNRSMQDLQDVAGSRASSIIGLSGIPTRTRWSDKVRRDRSLTIKVSECKDISKGRFADRVDVDNFMLVARADGREIGRSMPLPLTALWNETFRIDANTLHDAVEIAILTRRSKQVTKDIPLASVRLRRDVLFADMHKHEEWCALRDIKDNAPELRVELEWSDEGPNALLVKVAAARNLRRSDGVPPSAYVIVQLLPDEFLETPRRTKVHPASPDPVYMHVFQFNAPGGSRDDLVLHFSVWDYAGPGAEHELIGQLVLPVGDFDDSTMITSQGPYYPLCVRPVSQSAPATIVNPLRRSIASATSANNDKGAFVSFGQLTLLQERTLLSVMSPDPPPAHALQTAEAKAPTCCDQCGGLVLPPTTIERCSTCNVVCHSSCVRYLLHECHVSGQLRLTYRFNEEVILPYGAYNNLLELLTDDNLLLLTSLGRVCDQLEEVATTLLHLFESQGTATQYLCQLISYEVKSTRDPNTIFRGNSLASKSLDSFMKVVGREYLTTTLKDIIDKIYTERKNCEVNPARLEGNVDEVQKRNMRTLVGYVKEIIDTIFQSVDRCPKPMRQVFSYLQEEVTKQFPEDRVIRYTAVSGFIFLRFFCPCVLGPKLFGIRDDMPDATVVRTLTLVAKVLQNLANGVEFGQKELYMTDLNLFIAQEKDSMRAFIDTLANNWQTARERVREMEQKIDFEQRILDNFLNMQQMMQNSAEGKKKRVQLDLAKSIHDSREKITSLAREMERLRRMIASNSEVGGELADADNYDHSRLFQIDVERELAAIHRHIKRRKEAVLKLLEANKDESSLLVAADLINVLDQLDEIRHRLDR